MGARRLYRKNLQSQDLAAFQVNIKETDLWVAVDRSSWTPELKSDLEKQVWSWRSQLENYIKTDPEFKTTLKPHLIKKAPPLVYHMARAGHAAGVGPMAAVAGALAEAAGQYLLHKGAAEVIVENGGDIFLTSSKRRSIGIFAGKSSWSGKIGLEISPGQTPLGICTSSATVGPSYSEGCADAVVVLSPSTPLADAVATALGNRVKGSGNLQDVVERCRGLKGISGALVICGEQMAAWGDIRLCSLSGKNKPAYRTGGVKR